MSETVACNAGLAGEDDWVRVFWLSLRGPESPANDESSAVQQHFFSCPPACCSLSHQQTWAKLHGVCHRRLHGRLPVHLALHQLDRQLADSKFVGENLSEVGAASVMKTSSSAWILSAGRAEVVNGRPPGSQK